LHIPLLVVLFLSTHDNVGAPQIEGSIILYTYFEIQNPFLWLHGKRRKLVIQRELHKEAYG
jgi:hypothetical protein